MRWTGVVATLAVFALIIPTIAFAQAAPSGARCGGSYGAPWGSRPEHEDVAPKLLLWHCACGCDEAEGREINSREGPRGVHRPKS